MGTVYFHHILMGKACLSMNIDSRTESYTGHGYDGEFIGYSNNGLLQKLSIEYQLRDISDIIFPTAEHATPQPFLNLIKIQLLLMPLADH